MSPSSPLQRESERLKGFLLEQGLKLTRERKALFLEIFSSHYHFEADELLFKMKEKNVKISRATIYRTLDLLVRSGLVRRVHLGEDHFHYERITGDSHHDHLVCTTCGSVIEFHDEPLEERQLQICEKNKFTPTYHNLQILGVCARCSRKGSRPDSPDRVKMIHIVRNSLRK